ncbi:MAG: iron-sulfur cluster assembly scaffold protein [Gammaproteobacteria bacterium]
MLWLPPWMRPPGGSGHWDRTDMDYPEAVLAHFAAPQHAGKLSEGPGQVVSGQAGELGEGVVVSFQLRVLEGGIQALRFRAYGCPYTLAACSLAAEGLQGAPVDRVREFSIEPVAEQLQVPPGKRGAMLRIEDALRSCWRAWDNSQLSRSSASRSDP